MRVVGSLVAMCFVVLMAVPAHAMNWSMGANLGYSRYKAVDVSGAKGVNSFGWPSRVLPGIRFGFTGENPMHEVYIDTDLGIESTEGISSRFFVATANYQYNFGASGSMAPYVTAGGGFTVSGAKNDFDSPPLDISSTSAIFGAGVGVRHKMGNGHGTLRAEVRFDRTTEGKDGGVVIDPEFNIISVKLGFDLWDK